MKKIIFFLAIIVALASCEPPEVGYISDNIHALEDTVFVPRGIFTTSAAPAAEGSTYPLNWEITSITDAEGSTTDVLFDKYEILTWKEAFNGDTDTSLELAKEKLELSEQPSILINDVSGEMAFTQASKFVTGNDIFHVNVKVSNVRGEKQLDDFVVLKLEPFKPVEFPVPMIARTNLINQDGSLKALYSSTINNGFDDAVPSVLDDTHPYFSIVKESDEPKDGVVVNMTIADSHDNAIHPSKVLFYPSGAGYLQNFHDNSVETTSNETSYTFMLPAPPFPQFGRTYSGNNTYLMYYITSRDAFTVDKEAYETDKGEIKWEDYQVNEETEQPICQGYIRWGIKINDSGTWNIKMRMPYSKILNSND